MFGFQSHGIRELLGHQAGSRRTKRVRVSRRFRQRIYIRDAGCCVFFDKPVPFDKATLDHVVPLTRGGKNRAKENFAISCKPCNDAKGPLMLQDMGDLAPNELCYKFDLVMKRIGSAKGNYPSWIAAHS